MAEVILTTLFSDANITSNYRLEGNGNDAKGNHNATASNLTFSSGNGKYGQGAGVVGSSNTSNLDTGYSPDRVSVGSLSFWIKDSSTHNDTYFGGSQDEVGGVSTFALVCDQTASGAGKIGFWIRNGANTSNVTIYSTSAINDGNWHHVVCIWGTSGGMELWIDNTQVATNAATAYNDTGTNSFVMGGLNRSGGIAFSAPAFAFDDIAWFTKRLSSSEIAALFGTGPTTSTSSSTSTTSTSTSTTSTSSSTSTTTSSSTSTSSTSTSTSTTSTSTSTTSTSSSTSTTTSSSSSTSTTSTSTTTTIPLHFFVESVFQ